MRNATAALVQPAAGGVGFWAVPPARQPWCGMDFSAIHLMSISAWPQGFSR